MEPLGAQQHRHRRIDDARSLRDALRYELSSSGGQLHQLPDERELSKKLGCSRNALRVALNLLRDEHLIERRQGSGTLVVGESSSLLSQTQSLMDIIGAPNRVRYQMLETKVVTAAGAIAELLGVAEGEPLLVLSRLTMVDGSPTCLWDTFIPEAKGLPLIESSSSLDFFEMLHEALGIATTVIAMRVEAVVADASVTELLQIAIGQPLLRYERVTSDDAGNVIALSFGRARADRVAMVVSGRRTIAAPDSHPQPPGREAVDLQRASKQPAGHGAAGQEAVDAENGCSKVVKSGVSKSGVSPVITRPVITSPFISDPVSASELEVQLS